ncbi:hypothetical protein GOBAR_DD10906 [Gossypium barbadense]|nr:hypothetical protein GOBAR_DD10906 [Gossypium barbadense]
MEGKLSEEKLIRRLFVFSDIEFDDACGNYSEYMNMESVYNDDDEEPVPEIVFWNLSNSSSTLVVATQDGVALVSGYSKNLLKLFLDEGGIVNPEQVMEFAIAGGEYKKLVIHD